MTIKLFAVRIVEMSVLDDLHLIIPTMLVMINNIDHSELLSKADVLRRYAESDPEDIGQHVRYLHDWWNTPELDAPGWPDVRQFGNMVRIHQLQLEAQRSNALTASPFISRLD